MPLFNWDRALARFLSDFPSLRMIALCVFLYLLWQGVKEFRTRGGVTAFFPALMLAVLVIGVHEWFTYYANNGAFFAWPLGVLVVLLVLGFSRFAVIQNARRKDAEELRELPPPYDTGGGPADKRDFKDW